LATWLFDEQTKQKGLTTKAKKAKISDSKAPPKEKSSTSIISQAQKTCQEILQNNLKMKHN
jgi:hypothetical protein